MRDSLSPRARRPTINSWLRDIGHLRTHGAGDNPGRDHRQGEGRQQHELQVRPVPLPAHLAYRPAAGGRQQRELDAAEDHQQHPQPVVRHADAKHRQYRGQTVNDAVAKIASDKAEQAAEDKTDRRRQQRQAQRGKPPRSSLRLSPGGRWRPTYQGRRAAPATASG